MFYDVASVLIQPTSLCNLNCRYCYLPSRDKNLLMSIEVAEAIAEAIRLQNSKEQISVIWHGGEPLACGLDYFQKLIEPFHDLEQDGRIAHIVQTNATFINDAWCEFFIQHQFNVGVSIDGPDWANENRVNWSGKSAYPHIVKGVSYLQKHQIPFSALAVVSETNIKHAKELYEFFCELDCDLVGINIEEQEGVNIPEHRTNKTEINQFWTELFNLWRANPQVEIREISKALNYIETVLQSRGTNESTPKLNLLPNVAYNGDVYFLSGEFVGISSQKYDDFIVGNLLSTPFKQIIKEGVQKQYVLDFLKGVARCKESCSYYNYCGGGQASNKYFELGSTDGTETDYCINIWQTPIDVILESAT